MPSVASAKARFLRLAESIPYEGPLPDGTASMESGVTILRATFGYGGIQIWSRRPGAAQSWSPGLSMGRVGALHAGI